MAPESNPVLSIGRIEAKHSQGLPMRSSLKCMHKNIFSIQTSSEHYDFLKGRGIRAGVLSLYF